jgi:hypothetical protein
MERTMATMAAPKRRAKAKEAAGPVLPIDIKAAVPDPVEIPVAVKPARGRSTSTKKKDNDAGEPKVTRSRSRQNRVPSVPAVPPGQPLLPVAIVGRGRGRPRKPKTDSTGNPEIKGKNNARTKKIKDKEYIATTAPVLGYYDVKNDPRMMKPKKIPANIINAIG